MLIQPKHWTIGFLSNNIWSFAGNQRPAAREPFLTQYFVTRNFEHGWFLASSPILTANWRAPDNNKWLVPFGGGFGKMAHFFDQTMVWQLHLITTPSIHNLPHPMWQVRLQVALLFPSAK